jgi:hypothetical protein
MRSPHPMKPAKCRRSRAQKMCAFNSSPP